MKKFWKTANFRLKAGLISTCFFLIIGFVVYFIPHTNPFTYNTYRIIWEFLLSIGLELPVWDRILYGC